MVREALKAIPAQSTLPPDDRRRDPLARPVPDDWKRTWFEIQKKWTDDVGTPRAVFDPFDIDAKLNSAYVVLGLLYGNGDFGKTVSIATRAGQDSDCNPSSAAGILGTMLGYSKIPAYWTQGLAAIEAKPFPFAGLSLNDAYALSFKHALAQITRDGGTVHDDCVEIATQAIAPVAVEQNFAGHFPVAQMMLRQPVADATTFSFEGVGFVVQGSARVEPAADVVLVAEVSVDGQPPEVGELPTSHVRRRYAPFWRYGLSPGRHTVTREDAAAAARCDALPRARDRLRRRAQAAACLGIAYPPAPRPRNTDMSDAAVLRTPRRTRARLHAWPCAGHRARQPRRLRQPAISPSSGRSPQIRPKLHRYCARMTGSVLDGEDVVQDALFEAYRKLDTFDDTPRRSAPGCSGSPTTAASISCAGAASAKRPRPQPRRRTPSRPSIRPGRRSAGRSNISSSALPPMERACVLLKDVFDYSLEDIAELVDSTVGGVKAALNRGRGKLAAAPASDAAPAGRGRPEIVQLLRALRRALQPRRTGTACATLIAADARAACRRSLLRAAVDDSPYLRQVRARRARAVADGRRRGRRRAGRIILQRATSDRWTPQSAVTARARATARLTDRRLTGTSPGCSTPPPASCSGTPLAAVFHRPATGSVTGQDAFRRSP